MTSRLKQAICFSLICIWCHSLSASQKLTLSGQAQASLYQINNEEAWLSPWLENGTGLTRYDEGFAAKIDHVLLEAQWDILPTTSFNATVHINPDGEEQLGLSEGYFLVKPLSNRLKHQIKLGYFYPQFSLENSDIGWNSPYTYNFSAINSWIAEELRPLGIEWQLRRPGRIHKSKHSYTLVASAYQQNDGLASLLSWRGWAVHNRQSVIGEKVNFADYFQFMPVENPNPTYVDINTETDGHIGFYVGAHYQYLRRTDVRLYIYDNMASPFGLEPDMQYSWRTKFVSLAALHKFNKQTRLLVQYMNGSTAMGDYQKGVHNDFQAWYVMLNHSFVLDQKQHRLSLRYDNFNVADKDANPFDPNTSNGDSITLSWRYLINKSISAGIEYSHLNSTNINRTLWTNWQANQTQNSLSATVQYHF